MGRMKTCAPLSPHSHSSQSSHNNQSDHNQSSLNQFSLNQFSLNQFSPSQVIQTEPMRFNAIHNQFLPIQGTKDKVRHFQWTARTRRNCGLYFCVPQKKLLDNELSCPIDLEEILDLQLWKSSLCQFVEAMILLILWRYNNMINNNFFIVRRKLAQWFFKLAFLKLFAMLKILCNSQILCNYQRLKYMKLGSTHFIEKKIQISQHKQHNNSFLSLGTRSCSKSYST